MNTLPSPAVLLVRLCRETSYELPFIAASLAQRVASGETTYSAMWEQAFSANSTPKTEHEAKAFFWFTAGMAAVRTLGLCRQELRPLAQREADMRPAYHEVLEGADTILFDARERLAVIGHRALLRTLLESSMDVMGENGKAAGVRSRLVVIARDTRRQEKIKAG